MILHLNKLESPSPKGASCQVWLKFAKWFWRRRFLNFVNVFLLFRNYLPLEKAGPLHLNKLESPLPKDALCQVWLKFAQWFWRRRFLNIFNIILHFRYNLPLEKGVALHYSKNWNPLHPSMLGDKFGRNWPSGYGGWKCEKFTDGQTNDRQQAIRKAHLSF